MAFELTLDHVLWGPAFGALYGSERKFSQTRASPVRGLGGTHERRGSRKHLNDQLTNIAVIIPAFNEMGSIEKTVGGIRSLYGGCFPRGACILP